MRDRIVGGVSAAVVLVVVFIVAGGPAAARRQKLYAPTSSAAAASSSPPPGFDRAITSRFEALRADAGDLGYDALADRLGLAPARERRPSFDPTTVRYW